MMRWRQWYVAEVSARFMNEIIKQQCKVALDRVDDSVMKTLEPLNVIWLCMQNVATTKDEGKSSSLGK